MDSKHAHPLKGGASEAGGMEPSVFEFLNHIAVVVSNIVSITLGGMVVVYAVAVGLVNGGVNSKVSFRLSLAIMCIDILYSLFQTIAVLTSAGWACNLSSFGVVFTTLMSTLLTCALSLNLQLIVIHGVTVRTCVRAAYFLVPLLVSCVVSALPVIFGQIGLHWQGEWYSCWFHDENTLYGRMWAILTFYGWILLSVSYCSVVVVLVVLRLHRHMTRLRGNISPKARETMLAANTAIKRVVLYPVVPIVCYLIPICRLVAPLPREVLLVGAFLQGLQGALNAIIFSFNPLLIKDSDNAIRKFTRYSDPPLP